MDDRQGSLRNSTPVWVGSPPGTGWGREHGPTTGSQNLPTSPFHFIYSLLSSLPVPTVTHFNVGFETFLLGKITNRYKNRQNRESLCGLPDKDLAFSLLWLGSGPRPRHVHVPWVGQKQKTPSKETEQPIASAGTQPPGSTTVHSWPVWFHQLPASSLHIILKLIPDIL